MTKSCGCLIADAVSKANTKHKMVGTRIYRIWGKMRSRCNNKNDKPYKNYGGRGIKVCKRWGVFLNFYVDMKEGYNDNLTIERIDNDKGYTKENCRWVSLQTQARNRRGNKLLTYRGKTQCLTAWAEELDFNSGSLGERLRRGWSIEDAFKRESPKDGVSIGKYRSRKRRKILSL